jgi:uncharacterized protein YndB with AHSA1/START domain
MAGLNASIEIRRPVADVFAFFEDLENSVVRTDPVVRSVVRTTTGPIAAGSTYRFRQRAMGRVRDQEVHVLAVEPNRRIQLEAAFGPVRPVLDLLFEPTSHGSRLTVHGDSRPIGPFRLLTPLIDLVGERNWRRRLELIKARLER